MGSLNEWEQSQLLPSWQKHLKLETLPSADTMGDVASKVECDDIRTIVKTVYRKLKRNKALKSGFHDNLFFLVIDGHECCSSYLRSCEGCLEREITTTNGTKIRYYHRYAMGMLISADGISIPLDVEMQKAGEDEVACSVRLVERFCRIYPRAFDVVMADGLYARAPFFKKVVSLGKEAIAVLKDERRELIKEARKRCEGVQPHSVTRTNGAAVNAWDIEGCRDWTQLEMPVRVVRTLRLPRCATRKRGKLRKIQASGYGLQLSSKNISPQNNLSKSHTTAGTLRTKVSTNSTLFGTLTICTNTTPTPLSHSPY
jgi:hypothetical protein